MATSQMATGAECIGEVAKAAEVSADFELYDPGEAGDVCHVSRKNIVTKCDKSVTVCYVSRKTQTHKRRLAHCGFLRYVGHGEDHRWWECKWWWWWR